MGVTTDNREEELGAWVTCAAETACPVAGGACMQGLVRRAAAHAGVWWLVLVLPTAQTKEGAPFGILLRELAHDLEVLGLCGHLCDSDSRSNTPRGRIRALHVSGRHL